jgi:ABC-2 type transport system permease protein
MRILDLVGKDIRQLVRDWRTIFFMLVMPVMFTLLFGFVFSGGDSEGDPRLPVGVLDLDGGDLSSELLALLSDSQVIRIENPGTTRTELEQAVTEDDLAALVIVPEGYSQAVLAGESETMILLVNNTSNTAQTVSNEIQIFASRLNRAVHSAQISTDVIADHAGMDIEAAHSAYFDDGLRSALAAWGDPPVRLAESSTGAVPEEGVEVYGENPFNQSSTSMMAQFAIAGLMGAAGILVLERKNGTMKRLMTTNLSRVEYLFGHYLSMFLMVVLQLLLLTIFGHLVLDVQYYRDPVSSLLLIVVSALFSASLGLLIGALAKKEEHVIIISLALMFILAGVGGAWVPLEFTPESFQQIAHLTPLAWMVDGFKDIVVRGLGLSAILPSLYALMAFAVGLFFLAVWRFRSL